LAVRITAEIQVLSWVSGTRRPPASLKVVFKLTTPARDNSKILIGRMEYDRKTTAAPACARRAAAFHRCMVPPGTGRLTGDSIDVNVNVISTFVPIAY
jgi:hypothetical protein